MTDNNPIMYVVTYHTRSGRTYTSLPNPFTPGQVAHARNIATRVNTTLRHALAAELHKAIEMAVSSEQMVTIGPCKDTAGDVAISGREIEAIAVEVEVSE